MFTLSCELRLPRPREEVFRFFADAFNLEAITPPWLRFRVLTPGPIQMQKGTRIHYRLKLHGIPIRWESEITVWNPPFCFVDEQRTGPYRRWIHEHRFQEESGETFVTDHVEYSVPGGSLVNRLFVAPDLHNIFEFRRRILLEIFGRAQKSVPPVFRTCGRN